MTLIRPIETEPGADDAFAMTDDLFQRSVSAMSKLIKQLEDGIVPTEAEFKKSMAALISNASLTMKERDRVIEQRKRSGGIVGDFAIDFDAAKLEIGRKLDLLRDVEGQDGVHK